MITPQCRDTFGETKTVYQCSTDVATRWAQSGDAVQSHPIELNVRP